MENRPELNSKISIKDFEDFYWLKEELLAFCRIESINNEGGKLDISDRIKRYLKTGVKEEKTPKIKPKSKFDWNNETLSVESIITDNYKNTENVRTFFQNIIGQKFKFNVKFMNWMKLNKGKTLYDAINEWKRIHKEKKTNIKPEEISPQFEYNKYIRDFLADNPKMARELAIKAWKFKKGIRGDNIYISSDLKLIEK